MEARLSSSLERTSETRTCGEAKADDLINYGTRTLWRDERSTRARDSVACGAGMNLNKRDNERE